MQSNESLGSQGSANDFCSWEAQAGEFAVRLRFRVAKWLGSHLIEGRTSSATSGEIGGILLGQKQVDAGKQAVLIEGFVPVPCSYEKGWQLSDRDKWLFKEHLERWHYAPEKLLYAVGYYWGTRNPDVSGIGVPDPAQERELFADQAAVFLHVKLLPLETSIGGFVFRENGHIGRLKDLMFPLSRDIPPAGEAALPSLPPATPPPLLASPGPTGPSSVPAGLPGKKDTHGPPLLDRLVFQQGAPGAVLEQKAPAPSSGTPQAREPWPPPFFAPPHPTRWRSAATVIRESRRVRVVSLCVLALALGIASYRFFWGTGPSPDQGAAAVKGNMPVERVLPKSGGQPATEQRIAKLDLEVVKEKDRLRLKWNKDTPVIASASAGILAVQDGFRHKDFYLDTPKLQRGAFDYAHRTRDVTFRLRVKTPAGEASEWVRVVNVDRSPDTAAVRPHSRGWAGPGIRKEKDIFLVAASKSTAPRRSTRPSSPGPEGVADVAILGLTPPISIPKNAPSPGFEGAARAELPAAPDANLPVTKTTETGSLAGPGVKPDEPNPEVQGNDSARTAPEPPGPIANEETANSKERLSPSTNPRPLLRITAHLDSGMQPLVPAGTKVVIKVYVDKKGKVSRAESVTKPNVNTYATRLALRAARELRFHPPQRDGRNVSIETLIEFEFPDEMR